MNPKDIFTKFVTSNKLMQLATVVDNHPWVCNVYFVADEQGNIYWTSARSRQHSQEIKNNPNVALTIVHDPEQKQAVQIAGEAKEVSMDDVERVNELYGAKFGNKPSRLQEVLANTPEGRAYYVLKPKVIHLWDEVNFPDSPKQLVSL